jgi:hypothetical protein
LVEFEQVGDEVEGPIGGLVDVRFHVGREEGMGEGGEKG